MGNCNRLVIWKSSQIKTLIKTLLAPLDVMVEFISCDHTPYIIFAKPANIFSHIYRGLSYFLSIIYFRWAKYLVKPWRKNCKHKKCLSIRKKRSQTSIYISDYIHTNQNCISREKNHQKSIVLTAIKKQIPPHWTCLLVLVTD